MLIFTITSRVSFLLMAMRGRMGRVWSCTLPPRGSKLLPGLIASSSLKRFGSVYITRSPTFGSDKSSKSLITT